MKILKYIHSYIKSLFKYKIVRCSTCKTIVTTQMSEHKKKCKINISEIYGGGWI